MPIFKAAGKLIYYAHVPKCAGSAVERYLAERFHHVAFQNTRYMALPEPRRWSRTSPQHIDVASLDLLFPPEFFDACFTIVRHPVARLVSAYHFQHDVERIIPSGLSFGEWLEDILEIREEQPFPFDNHILPMSDLVPEGATVFHLEHGLQALVPWCDAIMGHKDGPRALEHVNKRAEYASSSQTRVVPGPGEIARIAQIYAADFERFKYLPDADMPKTPAPDLNPETLAEWDAAQAKSSTPAHKLKQRITNLLKR